MKRKNTDGDDVVEEEAMIDDDPSSDESNTKTKSTLKPLCTPFFTKISQDGKLNFKGNGLVNDSNRILCLLRTQSLCIIKVSN